MSVALLPRVVASSGRRPDPLDPRQRSAVRAAGAMGLALVGAGAATLWGLLVAALIVAALRAAVIDLFDDVEWGVTVVRWVEALDAAWLAPFVLALVLLAVGTIALGCWSSTRRMRLAGVPDPVAVTLRGAALGVGIQAMLSPVCSALLALLALLTGPFGAWIVVGGWVVGAVTLSSLVGWVAGPVTWLMIARRRVRSVADAPRGDLSSSARG